MALLAWVIFLPALLAIPVFFFRRDWVKPLWIYGVLATGAEFALSLVLLAKFDLARASQFQFEGSLSWLPAIGASFHIGVDGMALLLVLLTTFLTLIGVLSSPNYIQDKRREYLITMLLLETGMIGVFASLDLLLFFIFWEAMLLPMYFLIGIWGHGRKLYAAYKFILYTMAGSVLLLASIIWLWTKTGSFDYFAALSVAPKLSFDLQKLLFLAFALAFAIKVPLFPFHTWLPHAHAEAPTAGSVLLAGVLLKMGVYGFLRFAYPLFPAAAKAFMPLIAVLALIGVIYGALMTWVQRDLKRLIAYSSVAHLGFIMLGVAAGNTIGLQGAMIQMINHGLSTGALFLIAGMLYERKHTRDLEAFGGLARAVPVLSVFFGIVMLSSVGLPGLNGFVGEFLCLLGAYQAQTWWAVVGVVGIILAAVYLLTMFQKVVFIKKEQKMPDLSLREWFVLTPLLVFIFWIGVYPKTFLQYTEPVSQRIAQVVGVQEPQPSVKAHGEVSHE